MREHSMMCKRKDIGGARGGSGAAHFFQGYLEVIDTRLSSDV